MIHRSAHADIEIPNVTLTDFVMHRAAELGEKPALVCGATGRSYSYAALADAIRRAAAGFAAQGIGKGDVVGIVSPNIPEFGIVFLAVASLGAINSTVNPVSTAAEIAKQFSDSGAKLIVTVAPLAEKCREAALGAPSVRGIISVGEAEGTIPFSSLFAHGDTVPPVTIVPSEDLVALPYSSGTSGIPKGVMLTHYNLVANITQFSHPNAMVNDTDRVLGVLPFFHIYGMVVILCDALRKGATIVTLPRFDLEQFLETMQTHRITYANLVPPILVALAKHPIVAKYDLSNLRAVFSGAAPLGEELASACSARIGCAVRQGYGLTETSPVTHAHPFDSDVIHYASVGPPIPNTECRIVDPISGEDVAVGERGELWIRGPQVMRGYFNKPEATAACMTADGWFKTGDVGICDERGWFSIVDRVKELIKYKGLQVAPAELEAILLGHPAVADAAVIPIPDEEAGEIPKAFIVAKAAVTADEIMAYVAGQVSSYKKVRRVEFIDAIPKSASGKILRRILVDAERAKHADSSSVPS